MLRTCMFWFTRPMRKHVENMFREGMGGKLGSRKWKNTTRRGPRMLPTGTHARTRPYSRSATKINAEKKRKEEEEKMSYRKRETHLHCWSRAAWLHRRSIKCGRIVCQVQPWKDHCGNNLRNNYYRKFLLKLGLNQFAVCQQLFSGQCRSNAAIIENMWILEEVCNKNFRTDFVWAF